MKKKSKKESIVDCAAEIAFGFSDAWIIAALVFIFVLILLLLRIKKRKKKGL